MRYRILVVCSLVLAVALAVNLLLRPPGLVAGPQMPHADSFGHTWLPMNSDATATLAGSSVQQTRSRVQRNLPTGPFVLDKNMPVKTGSAVDVVAALRPMAEAGDAKAAFGIYLKLGTCRNVLDSQFSQYSAPPEKRAALQAISAEAKDCAGAESLLKEQGNWLEQAADQGLLEAQIMYAIDAGSVLGNATDMLRDPLKVQRYKSKASNYLLSASNQGNIDAMLRVASGYNNGILMPQDNARAYAYYKAARLAMPNIVPDELVTEQEKRVPPADLARANTMAQSIYARCCARKK